MIFGAKVGCFYLTEGKRWSLQPKSGEKRHFGTKKPFFRDEKRVFWKKNSILGMKKILKMDAFNNLFLHLQGKNTTK